MGPCEKCVILLTTIACTRKECTNYTPPTLNSSSSLALPEDWVWDLPLCRNCWYKDTSKHDQHRISGIIGRNAWPVEVSAAARCEAPATNSGLTCIHTARLCGRKAGHSGPHATYTIGYPKVIWEDK